MKKYKVLVTDFDKTLADTNFEISHKVKEAIKKILEKGYIVSIASGRPFKGLIEKACKDLNLTSPQIVSGGAQIIDPKDGTSLWVQYFPKKSAEKLIKYFIQNKYDFSVESQGAVFSNLSEDELKGYGPDIEFKELEKLDFSKVLKMVLLNVALKGDPEEMEDEFNKRYPELNFIRSGFNKVVLDITSEKATKHLAVLELSKLLNIDPHLMVGIGDGYNDYPLLTVCGFKVAMASAPSELKESADLIVPSVDEDGFLTLTNLLLEPNGDLPILD